MLEYSETEQIISQIERLCNEMSINKNMAFQYLADELAQIYILSKIDNPMYIRKNAEKLRENISLFDVEKKLRNWKDLYGRTIRYKGEPIDSCSTEKWKTDLFSIQETQKCEYCKTKLTKESSEVDHYIPKDGGGLDQRSNFRISCNPCNNGKRQLSALFLFNTFNFSSMFSEVAIHGKTKLSKRERFQILLWGGFRCSKCSSDQNKLTICYNKNPDDGGSAVFGNSSILCDNCSKTFQEMEVQE